MKETSKVKGITLIALVITIIVLLILAGVAIATLTGENGILTKAMKAREEAKIREYEERINLIREEVRIENKGKTPTLEKMKIALEEEQKKTNWIANLGEKTVEGVDKIVLTTKEGYIFHITGTKTEYKRNGNETGENDLTRDDVIDFDIVGEWEEGEVVKITKDESAADYYELEYQIDSEEGEWTRIGNGDTVKVKYGSTIHARLVYATNTGITHSRKIGESEPTVVAKDIDTSNIVRKTDIAVEELFGITWGSDGKGDTEYTVTGNLNFNNTAYSNADFKNISSLEIGTYEVTCKITSPSNQTATAEKEVKVTTLVNTEVTNENNEEVDAKAIYSEYDLAYFRDLVNSDDNPQSNINGKLMETIELSNVSSKANGGWAPIGYWDGGDFSDTDIWPGKNFMGTFDGNGNTVTIISSSKDTKYKSSGLFGQIVGGMVKNLNVNGTIDAECNSSVGGIAGGIQNGIIYNCINNSNITYTGLMSSGGIVGYVVNSTIEKCTNNGIIYGKSSIGGVAGIIENSSKIKNCTNSSNIVCYGIETTKINTTSVVYGIVGGVVGKAFNSQIEECSNTLNATVTGNASTILPNPMVGGGIVGWAGYNSTISKSSNKGEITFGTSSKYDNNSGGLSGIVGCLFSSTVDQCYNTGSVKSWYGNENGMHGIAGIAGFAEASTIKNAYNTGEIEGGSVVGGIVGTMTKLYGFGGDNYIHNCYNISDSVTAKSDTYVHNFTGYTEYVNFAYCGWYKEAENKYYDKNSTYNTYKEYESLEIMKQSGAELLTLLENGEGTKDGKSLWAQSANINDGLPYLVNVKVD